ncbi:hypothetical protein HFN_0864 [Helicobacter fennelliae MRY12-0050]|uniref:Uncharacterized protein n=1 Tax=Helicobacter fennelliae MRY12-0050 TaxID=1325130 RepID=T1CS55_9HELI|nr:hypothetical protein HFN_0864 [Helicobacter fennelliae MRY12-0050]
MILDSSFLANLWIALAYLRHKQARLIRLPCKVAKYPLCLHL